MEKLIAFYDHKPKAIEPIGDGRYWYRWDINEMDLDSFEGHSAQNYACHEVCVETPMTSNKIVETVFIAVFGNNLEAKLINDYNAAVNGVLDESFKQVYIQFLEERKAMKKRIEEDWKAFEDSEQFINNNKVKK